MLLWQACDWMNALSIAQWDTRCFLNFSQGCLPGSAHVYGCPVMDDLGARWRKTPSNWWRVRCLFQHKRSPREQAFSILSTGHGVEHVNSAALIDQSGCRWIQFWIILSSMVNLSLLSKYICEIYSVEMFKGSTHFGCSVSTSVRQQPYMQPELCGIIFVMYGYEWIIFGIFNIKMLHRMFLIDFSSPLKA